MKGKKVKIESKSWKAGPYAFTKYFLNGKELTEIHEHKCECSRDFFENLPESELNAKWEDITGNTPSWLDKIIEAEICRFLDRQTIEAEIKIEQYRIEQSVKKDYPEIKSELKEKTIKEGQLRIYWIPQIPLKPGEAAFTCFVNSAIEAKKILETLALYDIYQMEHKIKPDFSNVGGLEIYSEGEWIEWYDEVGSDIDETVFDEEDVEETKPLEYSKKIISKKNDGGKLCTYI